MEKYLYESMDQLKTIEKYSEYQFKEKGSLFIGQAYPIADETEANTILQSIRKKFYDATHNCYAYKLLDDFKYSDDGEPNGTAGIRILNAITYFELVNILIISTRYFGGTKLGVGPLGKAYYESAHGTIEEAEIITKTNYSKISVKFDYEHTSSIHHFLGTSEARNLENLFEEGPIIQCHIKPKYIENLSSVFQEISKGKIELKTIEENVFLK